MEGEKITLQIERAIPPTVYSCLSGCSHTINKLSYLTKIVKQNHKSCIDGDFCGFPLNSELFAQGADIAQVVQSNGVAHHAGVAVEIGHDLHSENHVVKLPVLQEV